MKKFLIIPLLVFVAVTFVGCSSVTAAVSRLPDGRVLQIVEFRFDETTTQNLFDTNEIYNFLGDPKFGLTTTRSETTVIHNGESLTFTFGMYYTLERADYAIRLTLEFDNFDSYAYFNGIPHDYDTQTIDIQRNVFFVERTITMPNPFATFFESNSNRTLDIINHFTAQFGANKDDLTLVYVLASPIRRTSTNATSNQRTIDTHFYFFESTYANMIDEIVVFDRFANTPIWYGIGVGATVIFMLVLYSILKRKSDNQITV
ncbi:MAG: hypothetical protein FWE16_04220 [Firmicutes bacterium]|nr:hypothetical protein [Bacillota bacterium]